jgi:hypothetical protein
MNANENAAREINRLHAEVVHSAAQSKEALHAALVAAWQCGRLLVAEKERVRRRMGGGAWLLWLQQCFKGSRRTAARYMALAASVEDVSFLRGLSLRQVYFRLGIATEPKSRARSVQVAPLPEHVRLATRLLRALNEETGGLTRLPPAQVAVFRQDLRALFEQLRRLFEPNLARSEVSKSA